MKRSKTKSNTLIQAIGMRNSLGLTSYSSAILRLSVYKAWARRKLFYVERPAPPYKSMFTDKPVLIWCEQMFNADEYTHKRAVYAFKNKEDAAMFKLRWG